MIAVHLKPRAARAREWLFEAALPLWRSRGFDAASGCFEEKLNANGAPDRSAPRRTRVQARQTFVYALAGRLGWSGPWREATEAGAAILLSRVLREDGGTNHLLHLDGKPLDRRRDLYDAAFALFGLTQAAAALPERADLRPAAEKLADWIAAHWAHPNGGFLEGEVTPTPPRRQNPHMHMFEALLALHDLTGDGKWLQRASAIGALFEMRFFAPEPGALLEYFDDSWAPAPGDEGRITEPGHQFEWVWLLERWRRAGGKDLRAQAAQLYAHADGFGLNATTGAVADEVWVEGEVRTATSRLWPHTERLKASLIRFEQSGEAGYAEKAADAFDTLMRYCDMPLAGLWRDRMRPDGTFEEEPSPASSFYHIALAMAELIRVSDAA